MISPDEVYWLYKCLLGREPENETVVEDCVNRYGDFATAREQIMLSREFINGRIPYMRYRPTVDVVPATKSRTQTLALACIVKNEEARIEIMLRSALPVIDFVVIVDTGSTDGTMDKAAQVLAGDDVQHVVIRTEFVDFSQARNVSLNAVPPDLDWILILDGDEHLVPDDYWRIHALLHADVDGWQLPRFNFYDTDKTEVPRPYPDYQGRLIRNSASKPIRFVGAVHEQLINVRRWGFAPTSDAVEGGFVGGPHIHHMGQAELSLEQWQRKHDFYARLAAAA